jgi:hypothetical protein
LTPKGRAPKRPKKQLFASIDPGNLENAQPGEEILAVLDVDILSADGEVVLPVDAEVLSVDDEVPHADEDVLPADEDTVRQPRDVLQEIRNILDTRGKIPTFLLLLRIRIKILWIQNTATKCHTNKSQRFSFMLK